MKGIEGIISIAAALVGALVVALVVQSKNTSGIIQAAGSTFANSIKAIKQT